QRRPVRLADDREELVERVEGVDRQDLAREVLQRPRFRGDDVREIDAHPASEGHDGLKCFLCRAMGVCGVTRPVGLSYISAARTPRRNVSSPRPASMTYEFAFGSVTNCRSRAFESRKIMSFHGCSMARNGLPATSSISTIRSSARRMSFRASRTRFAISLAYPSALHVVRRDEVELLRPDLPDDDLAEGAHSIVPDLFRGLDCNA